MLKNAFYAQSGGVTAVINAQASGVIETARQFPQRIGKLYAGRNGIIGALREDLIDTSHESAYVLRGLQHTPGGAFGSCRYKLKQLNDNRAEYERLIQVFQAHDIGYFFYNGGGDSQDTTHKVWQISQEMGYPLTCIGIPKTIDNDLPFTDTCPGFGSVAKYVAVSIREAGLDVASMASSSTKVFILEVMGRHAGWIAAASGLASTPELPAPHIILLPEVILDPDALCKKVQQCVDQYGYCTIVASEGIKNASGEFISAATSTDAFGHAQLGGVAPKLADLIHQRLKLKYHWAVSDYLQRSARHIASATDVEQAYALGKSAVEFALAGQNAVMPIIKRLQDSPYSWEIESVPLEKVANVEKILPKTFITADGFGITEDCKRYLAPLIQGEAYPPFQNGLPDYVMPNNQVIEKKCPPFTV